MVPFELRIQSPMFLDTLKGLLSCFISQKSVSTFRTKKDAFVLRWLTIQK
jgi:hypothetical protein